MKRRGEIIDQGSGLPAATLDDIFVLFHTTKKEDTGLGFPIVKKVMDAHSWPITVL